MSKQSHYSENTIYPYAEISDLDAELIARARRLATIHQRSHPWETMDDRELLTSARLIQKDFLRNEEGLTLAAILLFGKDETILSVLPHHKTDAILRKVNVDRYDDRDDIRTNLLDSHDRLLAFGEKHLSDPFFLEGTQRISLRSHILREIIGNLLIHREYSHAFPAKFVIERDCLFSENSNRPHGHGPIDPRLFSPYPKNPVIAKVFKEIGWADELGSGVRKLFRYGKAFGGYDPQLIEGDIFSDTSSLSRKRDRTFGRNPGNDGRNPGNDGRNPGNDGRNPGNDGRNPGDDGGIDITDSTRSPTNDPHRGSCCNWDVQAGGGAGRNTPERHW